MAETKTPSTEINISTTGSKATVALFAPMSEHILTGHESGKIGKYSVKTGEQVAKTEEGHFGEITDIQLSPDGTYFITSSKDKTAKVGSSFENHYKTVPCGVVTPILMGRRQLKRSVINVPDLRRRDAGRDEGVHY